MLLADIKVFEHRLIYIDLVQASLDDGNNLTLKLVNKQVSANLAIKGADQDTVWV